MIGQILHRLKAILPAVGILVVSLTANAATITGTVRSADGANIAGALVRTDGEPGYSATTGTDGAYVLTIRSAGAYSVLASASGYTPQRMSLSLATSSSAVQDFGLHAAGTGSVVSLPAPLNCGEPVSAPSAPGDSFPVSFADMGLLPDPGAPQICGWHETVKPNESFTLTGSRFTSRTGADLGTDTTVWVWARTSSSAGVLRQARVWQVRENSLMATLPDDVPFGMYLVWVENSVGVSGPVCINKTAAQWLGPLGNIVQAGNKKRVFGRNISYNHGTDTSYVFIQPASGGAMISCPTNSANPYMVEFTVPVGTPDGNYKVYAHNGQGGVYGWSDGLDLVVQPDWVRDTYETNLSPSGGDDTSAIQSAINTLTARAAGGTVRLSAGTFKTYSMITLKAKVRLLGAGMDSTTIELRQNTAQGGYFMIADSNITVEGVALKGCISNSPAQPTGGHFAMPYPAPAIDSFKLINTRVTSEDGVFCFYGGWGEYRTEMSGCEFYRAVSAGWADGWIHDCKLYGGPFGVWPPITPGYTGETEAAYNMGTNAVLEYSHVETKNWPMNVDGNQNYTEFLSYPQFAYKPWAKRIALVQNYPLAHNYIAYLTSKDVAIQDNKGEMILFHGMPAQWLGNVISMDGLTMNLRTDGTVNGQTGIFLPDYTNPSSGVTGGSTVPDAHPSYIGLNGSGAIIISGTGLGQQRTIVSHTATSITIDRPWRTAPDSTSVILITPLYVDNTIYSNDLNAFPINYGPDMGATANTGVDFDGNSWNCAVEGNSSHRTNSARCTFANGGPTYWCTMRDETATENYTYGYRADRGDLNPMGMVLLGNAFRNCSSIAGGQTSIWGEGCIFENMNLVGVTGYILPGTYPTGAWPQGSTIFRNGAVTVAESPLQPVYVSLADRNQYLVGNAYSGNAQTYWYGSGASSWANPVALYRVARFKGYVGRAIASAMFPIANAGTAPMTWTLTPGDSWIAASIQSNAVLSAESSMGRLVLSVDTTGMIAGRHWGSVTVNTGGSSIKLGVCVDLADGTPPSQSPSAVFAATPAAGTSPLSVAFNATSSNDLDGSIVSYGWDFGDGAYGTGVTTSHTYTGAGTYTPVLTVTDDSGESGSSWSNVTVSPALTTVNLTAVPAAPVDPGTAVTLTAAANGGYQPQYRFLIKTTGGWTTLRDFATGNTFTWTPSTAGYYEIKVQARASDSTRAYDVESSMLSYPVGQIPSAMRLWLKADAGVTRDGAGRVSAWADQSGAGNNLGQTNQPYQPICVDGVINGSPVVRFGGGSQMLQSLGLVLSGSTPFTAFSVVKFNSVPASTYQYVWWNGIDDTTKGYGCHTTTTPRIKSAWGSWDKAITYQTDVATDTWYRICSRWAGGSTTGNHQMWMNGVFVNSNTKTGSNFSGGFFSLGNFGPGSTMGFYGDVAEMLIYNRSLTDAERVGVESYLAARWTPSVALGIDRLKDVKALNDGVLVSITSAKVAGAASGTFSDGSVYVMETDRTCGLKITGAGTVGLWDNLTISGTTDTDATTGEKVLRVTSVTRAAGTELTPIGISNKTVTATAQLLRVWGKVTAKNGSYLTLDDGSGLPVRVQIDGLVTPLLTTPNVGDYASATGPVGLMAGGVIAVRVRSGSDIQVY